MPTSAAGTSLSTGRADASVVDAQASVGAAAPSHTSEGTGADRGAGVEQETEAELKAAADSSQV